MNSVPSPRTDLPTLAQVVCQVKGRIPRMDARLLLQHTLGIDHVQFLTHGERRLTPAQLEQFMGLVMRREREEPLAYLTGEREFYGRSFHVSPAVLIPRPDTELLVMLALEHARHRPAPRIADLGTGSGAVAVTLALECPTARVTATDLSPDALAVARANGERLGARVDFRLGDWLTPLAEERFDLIVSNPPYVAARDPHLAQNGLPFEPDLALTDGGDGLSCLRAIVAAAPACLVPGGWLFLEHGYDQAAAVRELLRAAGFKDIASRRDLGDIERVSGGRLPRADGDLAD